MRAKNWLTKLRDNPYERSMFKTLSIMIFNISLDKNIISLQVVLAYLQVGFAYLRVGIAAAPVGLVHLILTNMKTRKRTIQTYIIAMEDFNAKVGGHTHTSNCT